MLHLLRQKNPALFAVVLVLVLMFLGLGIWLAYFTPEKRCAPAAKKFVADFAGLHGMKTDDAKWSHHYSPVRQSCFVRYTDKVEGADNENGAVYDAFTGAQYVGIAANARLNLVTCFVAMETPQKRPCENIKEYYDRADALMTE